MANVLGCVSKIAEDSLTDVIPDDENLRLEFYYFQALCTRFGFTVLNFPS